MVSGIIINRKIWDALVAGYNPRNKHVGALEAKKPDGKKIVVVLSDAVDGIEIATEG